MTINARKRQKKLQRKAKKKKQLLKKKKKGMSLSKNKAANYSNQPIYECLIPDTLFDIGIGNVIVSRRTPSNNIAFSAFVVDVYCLGVKDAFFRVASEIDYKNKVKDFLMMCDEGRAFRSIQPACARKLVEGAIDYAEELGFSYHPDYKNAKDIFGNIDSLDCPTKYTYGKDGKPFYFQGPNESMDKAKKIINQLRQRCGEGSFHFTVKLDGGF